MFGYYSKNAIDNKLKAKDERIDKLESEVLILQAYVLDQKVLNDAIIAYARKATEAFLKLNERTT